MYQHHGRPCTCGVVACPSPGNLGKLSYVFIGTLTSPGEGYDKGLSEITNFYHDGWWRVTQNRCLSEYVKTANCAQIASENSVLK